MSGKQKQAEAPKDPAVDEEVKETDEETPQVADEAEEEAPKEESTLWDGIPEDHPIRKEFKSLRDEAAARRVENKSLKDSFNSLEQRVEELDSPEDYQKAIAEANRKAEEAQLELKRVTIGNAAHLPPALHSRLQGKTEDELKADAAALQKELGIDPATGKRGYQGPPKPPATGGLTPSQRSEDSQQILKNLRGNGRKLGFTGTNTK